MLEAFETDELRKLVDQELTYANRTRRISTMLVESAKNLKKMINQELNK